MDYPIKDRSAKVAKRRNAMVVTGRSVFVIQSVQAKKGREAAVKMAQRQGPSK